MTPVTVFSCLPDWEAMLTCIYKARSSGIGHQNLRLELEPIGQTELFNNYIHVDYDEELTFKVIDAINNRISSCFYSKLAYVSMAYEPDVLNTIYHVLILGFTYGESVLNRLEFRDIIRFNEINKRVGMEACHFKEFLRFHEIRNSVYVAHIEPKSRIIPALGMDFTDRMPSEHWIIVDDVHRVAAIHPKDEDYYIQNLNDYEYEQLLKTENENDEYTDLWQLFFDTIAIKERENSRCQRNLFPLWTRTHAVEFIHRPDY